MWGQHLHHSIAHRQGTQKHCEEKKSHVEVSGGRDSKEIAGRLVEEVDGESSAVEEQDTLEETDAWKEGAKQDSKPAWKNDIQKFEPLQNYTGAFPQWISDLHNEISIGYEY